MTFQLISENNVPKFVVLPFGDWEALEDYADELWAAKAVREHKKAEKQKTYSLNEVKKMLDPELISGQ
jgi:PHD/YefM family antitoxin component YafN of YafNO toxin-antitoxin module